MVFFHPRESTKSLVAMDTTLLRMKFQVGHNYEIIPLQCLRFGMFFESNHNFLYAQMSNKKLWKLKTRKTTKN